MTAQTNDPASQSSGGGDDARSASAPGSPSASPSAPQAVPAPLAEVADTSVRVQDDLFLHAIGTWYKNHEIPGDRGVDGSFIMLRDRAEEDVRAIIESAADGTLKAEGEDAEKAARAGALYSLFMDEELAEKRGTEPLAPLLEQIDAASTVEELVDTAGKLGRSGASSMSNLFVSIDPLATDRNRIYVVQGGVFLPDESYYREEEFAEVKGKYLEHLKEFLPLVGIEGDAEALLKLEEKIASGHWDKVRTRDAVARNNPFTAAEFERRWPLLKRWISAHGATEEQQETIIVWQPEALDTLVEVLQSTDLDLLKLWQKNQAAHFAAPYLDSAVVKSNWDFVAKTLSGATEQRDRWKRAVAFVEGAVGEDIGRLFVAEHFPPAAKDQMLELVDYLIRAYRESISGLEWMTETTRAKALEKLSQFVTKIGYPEEWTDYSAVEVHEGDLLATAMSANEAAADREFEKIDRGVTGKEWLMTPQTVNAYYMPPANEIVFPAAILRPPFFDPEADAAVNFAGIGAVIGHEIGHGFDDQGSRYNGKGELENWWTEEDLTAFTERTAKLVAQYDGLAPLAAPDSKVNGSLTLGENIGDLGGLSIGLKAYKLYLADKGETLETTADVDGVTALQRFFYSWATIWQAKSRKETAQQRVATDPHSPAEFRANQTVKNLDAFHEAFGTQPGDGMYLAPADRVSIW